MKRISALVILLMAVSVHVWAAVTVSVNGTNHTIPETGEKGWGANVTAWIQAISSNTLHPSGGTFTLTADANFGANYGLVSSYFKSRSSNISTAGILRLANTDTIGFRNAANGGNLLLGVDSSDRLTFNSNLVSTATTGSFQDSTFEIYDNSDNTKKIAFQASGITTATTRTLTVPDANLTIVGADTSQTLTNKTLSGGSNTFTDIPNSATTATSSNTNSAIVARDGSGDFSAGIITAALSGNASTATALAANPSDCSADNYATAIDASGNLTCGQISASAGITGQVPLANGGTAKNMTAVNGGVVYSDADSLEVTSAGTSGQFLRSTGAGAPAWSYPITVQSSQTTTYAIAATDNFVPLNAAGGDFTATLPTAASVSGKEIILKKTDSSFGIVTIATTSSQTIDGVTTTTLNTQYETLTVVSDGSNWHIRSRHIPSVWTSFTPTGSFTNVTYTGFWKRVGDTLHVRTYLDFSNAPGAATLTVNLPSGLTIDTAKLTSTDGSDGIVGTVLMTETGTAKYTGAVVYSSTSAVQPRYFDNSAPVRALNITASVPATWDSTDFISVAYEVPISGWK